MTGRKVPIWRGKTPDSKVPDRVRQRIFERYEGKCYLSHILIAGKAWDLDHIKPLHLGGTHSEENLAPVLKDYHKIKSAAEMKIKGKADRVARKSSGSRTSPKVKIQSRGFESSAKARPEKLPIPARRNLLTGERY